MEYLLTELPFGFGGRIFGSSMPFGHSDPEGKILDEYIKEDISSIALLVDYKESLSKASKNLRQVYISKGFYVIHLPIKDFDIPRQDKLEEALKMTISHATNGINIAVHCSSGIGRTGLFLSCLAKKVLSKPGETAIDWVREYIPGAVETSMQKEFVCNFNEG